MVLFELLYLFENFLRCTNSFFLRGKNALTEGRSPPQELEEGLRSMPNLLVFVTTQVWNGFGGIILVAFRSRPGSKTNGQSSCQLVSSCLLDNMETVEYKYGKPDVTVGI